MDTLSYNGVPMDVCQTRDMKVELVTNGSDRQPLYWRWRGDHLVWLNPQAISVATNGAVPDLTKGRAPGLTHNAIRNYMMQPRKRLIVAAGFGLNGFVGQQLDLPQTGYTCDANNGPIVRDFSILQVHGTRSLLCRFSWEAFEPLTPATTNTSPILSHEWKVISDVDEMGYATRTTQGIAIFRTDILRAAGTWPDASRRLLFALVPTNFQRQSVHVMQNDAANTIAYIVRDKEKCFNVGGNSGVRKFECSLTGTFMRGSVGSVTGATLGDTGSVGINFAGGLAAASTSITPGGLIGAVFSAGTAVAQSAYQHTRRALPRHTATCRARLWGGRSDQMDNLRTIALAVVVNRLRGGGVNFDILGPANSFFKIEQIVQEKTVDVTADVQWGMEGIIGMAAGGVLSWGVNGLLETAPAGMNGLIGLFTQTPDILVDGTGFNLTQQSNTDNPPPGPAPPGFTNDPRRLSYGSSLEQLVSQGFWEAAAAPPPVPPTLPTWSQAP